MQDNDLKIIWKLKIIIIKKLNLKIITIYFLFLFPLIFFLYYFYINLIILKLKFKSFKCFYKNFNPKNYAYRLLFSVKKS